jgi:hypothetical protein
LEEKMVVALVKAVDILNNAFGRLTVGVLLK